VKGEERDALTAYAGACAKQMGLEFSLVNGKVSAEAGKRVVRTKRAAVRDKRLVYPVEKLPVLDAAKQYKADEIITMAMKVFALDTRLVSVDSDLAKVSGLEAGVAYVDVRRGLNAGIAEANMMCIGESFAALGYNAWVSTFAPFFDWKVLRRIAVSYQERMEAIAGKDGWLAEGHGLDLTFLSLAPNIETTTNGATHMGNDDSRGYDGIAHLKIIDASCPQQVLSIMKWIMEGNRGLVYLRVLRAGAAVIYPKDFRFEFGRGYYASRAEGATVCIISSGHGVYEAIGAAKILESKGVKADVVDMPSYDAGLTQELCCSGKKIVIAEQNNGYLWSRARKTLFGKKGVDGDKIIPINLLDAEGNPRFLHSATYAELVAHNGLSAQHIADRITGGK
jgi:transketolase C-terminal domain/subunit